MEVFIKLGWLKLCKFSELSGITERAVRDRLNNTNFPEWRIGNGLVKKMTDGYYVNWESYQSYIDNAPAIYGVAS